MSNIGFQERIVTNAKFITFTWITLSKPTKLKKNYWFAVYNIVNAKTWYHGQSSINTLTHRIMHVLKAFTPKPTKNIFY